MKCHPHLQHRVGLFRSVQRLQPDADLIRRIGGVNVIEQIVDELYDRIHADAALRPMFRRDQTIERANQKKFFEEWFGGRPLYSMHVATAGLRQRHHALRIAPGDSSSWLGHFQQAMKKVGVEDALRKEILATLRPLALAFANDTDPVGAPDPDRHKCGKDHALEAACKAASKNDVTANYSF